MAVLPQNKASGSVIPARLRIRKRLLCKSNTPASSKKMRFTVGDFDLLPERGMEVDEERCAIDPSYRAAIEYLEICTPGDICPEVFDGDLKYRNCVNILVGGVAAKQKNGLCGRRILTGYCWCGDCTTLATYDLRGD